MVTKIAWVEPLRRRDWELTFSGYCPPQLVTEAATIDCTYRSFEDRMKSLLAFTLILVASQAQVSAATKPECPDTEKFQDILAEPTIAFQGEVVAVAPNPADSTAALPQPKRSPPLAGFDQKITFHVLKTLKGPYQVGDAVTLTVRVTTECAGYGCVFPFKIGDVTFVLAPSSAPSFFQGCWIYEGVAMQSILSVPDVLSRQSRH
jgi:hypothetical protein